MNDNDKQGAAGLKAVQTYHETQASLLQAYLSSLRPVIDPRSFVLPAVMTLQ